MLKVDLQTNGASDRYQGESQLSLKKTLLYALKNGSPLSSLNFALSLDPPLRS